MREAFIDAILVERSLDERLFVLDADCARSTKTCRFAQHYPDSFLNLGIAEQNLVGVAAGMALAGLRPVACTFAAMLVARAGEQILQSVAAQELPVKLAGHYAGMSGAREGAPHHSVADLAFLRAVPGMEVWIPADDADVRPVVKRLMASPQPGYVRLCREPVAPLAGGTHFAEGGLRFWGPQEPEVVLVAAGITVRECLAAARRCEERGIATAVLAILRLKPFPESQLVALTNGARLVMSVEEHSWYGGLGGAAAEALAQSAGPPLVRVGLRDQFTETGSYPELLDAYGLTAPHIERQVLEHLRAGAVSVGAPKPVGGSS
ncbi:MAG: transketolase C-terminal domain-containing protein [Acidobacteriota bacterium]